MYYLSSYIYYNILQPSDLKKNWKIGVELFKSQWLDERLNDLTIGYNQDVHLGRWDENHPSRIPSLTTSTTTEAIKPLV
jgi:hypothetical protein